MSEVMSQNEIDALLNAVSSGEVDVKDIKDKEDEEKVKKYDFKNPQKISKEQLRTLEVIYENFGRYMQTSLTGYLRATTSSEILTVDQFAYSEFSNAIPTPAFLSIIDFYPLKGQILMEISNNLVYTIIDRLLGGDGSEQGDFKSFTEIELSLLRNIVEKMLDDMVIAWENVIRLEPKLDKIEVNPQFAQIVPPNETIVLITMNLEIGGKEGMVNICLPYILLEPIIDKLNTRFWFSSASEDESVESAQALQQRVEGTEVPVIAELGKSVITVNELLNLQRGDIITLGSVKNKINVKVGSNNKFKGEVGTLDKHMAVMITEIIKEGK